MNFAVLLYFLSLDNLFILVSDAHQSISDVSFFESAVFLAVHTVVHQTDLKCLFLCCFCSVRD